MVSFGDKLTTTFIFLPRTNKYFQVKNAGNFYVFSNSEALRGATATKAVQYSLVLLQIVVLVWYSIAAWQAAGDAPALPFSWDWFNPLSVNSFAAFAAGLSLSIFIYWGWDVCLTLNEEASEGARTPGRAAALVIFIVLTLYLAVAVSTMRFAGLGDTGLGLSNATTRENVLAAMAGPVMGPFAILVALAVLASSVGCHGGVARRVPWSS